MIQSHQANTHQLSMQWKCRSCFCWCIFTVHHEALGASPRPNDSFKAWQDWGFHPPGKPKGRKRHDLGRSWTSECRDCNVSYLEGSPIAKQSQERFSSLVLECPEAVWKQLLVVCACPWSLFSGGAVQGSTVHVAWQAWGLSWDQQRKSKSASEYQVRETPRGHCSLVCCEARKKMLNTAKFSEERRINSHQPESALFMREERRLIYLSLLKRKLRSASLCEEKALCHKKGLFLILSGQGLMRSSGRELKLSLLQMRTHRRQQKVGNN